MTEIKVVLAYEDMRVSESPGERWVLKGKYTLKKAAELFMLNEVDIEHDIEETGFCAVEELVLVPSHTTKAEVQKMVDDWEREHLG